MKKPRRSIFRILLLLVSFVAAAVVLAGLGAAVYCFFLSIEIDERFSARKWSIPSRVYSDSLLLYTGQQIDQAVIADKLSRLGYHEVSEAPEKSGEYRRQNNRIDVWLRAMNTPEHQRDAVSVRILFANNRIAVIRNIDDETPRGLLEIEPEELMLFFGREREQRRLISIEAVPGHVVRAVLAAEDSRFFSHRGFDFRGILRAFKVNLQHGEIRQGGSTITQQLAKNYFLSPEQTLSRKIRELFMAITLELMYEKDEILEIYLNEIYFGQKGSVGVNGIGEASFFYFDKPVSDLSVAEAAAIAGLIRGPNRYSPYVDRRRCEYRRDQVLQAMHENGWLDEMTAHQAMLESVAPAGFRAYGKKAPYFMDFLTEQLKTLYSEDDLSSLGLSVYTTLDTEVQRAAEAALENGLSRLEKRNPALQQSNPADRLQGAVIVMQPQTGNILAMVGGRNYAESQFNRAVNARRQPGSAFKPFVYAAGLEIRTPASLLSNIPRTYDIDGTAWTPKNYAELPDKQLRMRTALARSVNIATVDLAAKTGPQRILETSSAFGFSTIQTIYPSAALGAVPVIPLELARAYCPFAASGMLPFPLPLKEVMDETGDVLERRPTTISRAVSSPRAFLVSSMLQSAVNEGTGSSLRKMGIDFPVSGKTGTTNDYRDAWFVGFTPDILALVWVGFDDGRSVQATGAAAALPIWADLMSRIPQHVSGASFIVPEGVTRKVICAETGQLAVASQCPEPVEEYFEAHRAPSELCGQHRRANPFKKVIDDIKGIFTD